MSHHGQPQLSLAFGLELPARAIAPLHVPSANETSASTVHRFIVGTCNYAGGNKLQLLEMSEDHTPNSVECAAVWTHENEIVSISPSPSATEQPLFSVIHRTFTGGTPAHKATLYALPSLTGDVVPVATIASRNVRRLVWEPHGARKIVAAIVGPAEAAAADGGGDAVALFNVESSLKSSAEPAAEAEVALPQTHPNANDLAWNPHHAHTFAVAANDAIVKVDARAKSVVVVAASAHVGNVLSVDFNPNRMHVIASSGEDGAVRVWDLRKTDAALLTSFSSATAGHGHWVTQVRFNPTHDQILLTASADFTAKLWHAQSLVPLGSQSAAAPPQAAASDSVVRTLSDFGESVQGCAWSAASPWVYAALSFNGKVVLDRVPQDLVMSILMGTGGE